MSRRLSPALLRELLLSFLPDYLCLAEPESATHLDLARLDFLPNEDPSRIAATVPVRSTPENVTILVLLRERFVSPAETGEALRRNLASFNLRYAGDPVLLSVIYLEGGKPGFNLETASVCRLFGLDILRLYFTACGLAGIRAEYYAERSEPLAWALAPHLTCSGNPARLRDQCREQIAASGLPEPTPRAAPPRRRCGRLRERLSSPPTDLGL